MNTRTAPSIKDRWKHLHGKQKLQYVWDYYKLPIAVCLIFFYVIGYILYGHFSKKDVLLYAGLVNISAGEQLTSALSRGFIDSVGANPSKTELKLYTGLYLTDEPEGSGREYAYASRIKILASVDNEQLDVVLMNREAFDLFSHSGYLSDLEELFAKLDAKTAAEWEPYLAANTVMQTDSAAEEYPMGLRLSQKGLFEEAGLDGDVYLGVIKNTPRTDMVIEYIKYLKMSQSN